MIFDGLETTAAALCHHDEHDLNLSSVHTQEVVSVAAPAIDPEQIAPCEDGMLNPVAEFVVSAALEPHTNVTSRDIYVTETTHPSPAIGSELCASMHIEHD